MSDFSGSPYYPIAVSAANTYGIPANLFIAQIAQESSFLPNARNGNATGIAQFMPSTAASLGINPNDPTSSLYGAAAYDAQLYQKTGSYTGMLNAYGTTAGGAAPGLSSMAAALDANANNNKTPAQQILGTTVGSALDSLNNAITPAPLQANATNTWNAIGDFFALISNVQRMATITAGIIFLLAGLYMLGNKEVVAITSGKI